MNWIKNCLKPFYIWFKRQKGIKKLKSAVKKGDCKIVIGASGKFDKGWTATDIDFLNLVKKDDWDRFFKPESIRMILAEHVWEHLYPEEAKLAAANCYVYLKHGGHLRIAVPDGNHKDPDYINKVKPGGYGDGANDHKVIYTISTITELFESAGFVVKGLEYFDEGKNFVFNEWDPEQGKIYRSKRFDPRNVTGTLNYTSLIIDAVKN